MATLWSWPFVKTRRRSSLCNADHALRFAGMNIAFVDRGRFGGGVGGGAFRGGGSTSSSLLRLSLVGLIVTGMLGRGRLLAAGGGAESVASNGLDWPAGADDVYLSCTFRVSILAFSMMLFGLRAAPHDISHSSASKLSVAYVGMLQSCVAWAVAATCRPQFSVSRLRDLCTCCACVLGARPSWPEQVVVRT